MDSSTRDLLAGSLRSALREDNTDIATTLAELGWDEVVADDPITAVDLLFTEHGRVLARTRVLDTVVLPALELPTDRRAVGYPIPPSCGEPTSTSDDVDALVLGPLDGIDELVVPTRDGILLVPTADLSAEPVRGLDAASRWHRIRTGGVVEQDGSYRWPEAMAIARKALAAEIIGIAGAALAVAVEHTGNRHQFGRSVASFQAVRHRLAEAHVAVTGARAVLDAAWQDGGSWSAIVAKAEAGRAQHQVSRHVMQVCGAIGLTEEHELHRHVARAAALDTLLGGFRLLETEIGEELLAGAELAAFAEI